MTYYFRADLDILCNKKKICKETINVIIKQECVGNTYYICIS